ncbi:MAG: TIM barrel protein [Phycisphaerae bacterium]|nr:TIM barrel protein [Phycisphaerae bacterium]
MNRRNFLAAGLAGGTALTSLSGSAFAAEESAPPAAKPFKLKYAPSIDMFRQLAGDDMVDRIRFMHDQGFGAVFDNGLMNKPADQQEKIVTLLNELKMDLGPFVGYANFGEESFVLPPKDMKDKIQENTAQWIETHKRTGAKWVLVVPGRYNQRLEWDYQTANVVENLKYCTEACQKAGLVIVLEPLNPHDHPGLFLTKMPQAYQICQAVDNPSCKIVNDLYHQQITEGNLIPNIDRCWSRIGAFHIGDNPGRKEPGTGEINYKNIFMHLNKKGYEGVLCCEHGLSQKGKDGEVAFIEAYRAADNFSI